jgi:hypothetical protein
VHHDRQSKASLLNKVSEAVFSIARAMQAMRQQIERHKKQHRKANTEGSDDPDEYTEKQNCSDADFLSADDRSSPSMAAHANVEEAQPSPPLQQKCAAGGSGSSKPWKVKEGSEVDKSASASSAMNRGHSEDAWLRAKEEAARRAKKEEDKRIRAEHAAELRRHAKLTLLLRSCSHPATDAS